MYNEYNDIFFFFLTITTHPPRVSVPVTARRTEWRGKIYSRG